MPSHREEIDLSAELRGLRPTPSPTFAAELDARAEAGFPRAAQARGSRLRHLGERLRAVPAPRLVALSGTTALAALAVATAIVVSNESAPSDDESHFSGSTLAAPSRSGAASAAQGSSSELGATNGTSRPEKPAESAAGGTQLSAPVQESGPYAASVARRKVERSAELVLATGASEVRNAAAEVFDTVHAYNGIVLGSSISDGGGGEAAARFRLLVPSGKLNDALAAFSEIADVRSRHESTADVTAPTIGLEERLRDARARVESLLGQLADAETEAEREVAEAKLRSARRRVAALRGRLAGLQRRTHLSSVSLRIESGGGTSGTWGVGDALGDAGHILAVAAGVAVIAVAVLGPLALICLLAWLAHRTWMHRRRERALG